MALPAVVAGEMDRTMSETISSCALVMIVVAVVPWRYAWQRYALAKGDRWRRTAA